MWVDGSSNGYFEINICADHLNLPFTEICETLLHEMCHLLNAERGIKDTSREGTYHNRKFKETAEAHGLDAKKTADSKYGYSATRLTSEAREFVISLNIELINLYRELETPESAAKQSSSLKYACPSCKATFRATKELKVSCVDCDALFEIQG